MKVLLSWLREFCPMELSAEELAERLSPQGVKVEGVLWPWARLSGVVVARVLEVRNHPSSDKLVLARVDHGSGQRELVVGVRNMRPGDLVPLAGAGATVPGLADPLRRREIRGVVSEGMLCSPKELGLSGDHTGILILPPGTPLGADFKSSFGLDDAVLDIEVKSNRPDLMSVVGVAREAAAATGVPFTSPDASLEAEGEEKAEEVATVEVLDPFGCPRYLAKVIRGVTIGPSPITIQARLTASGMRPLSNCVDATNYVMLEIGQPMHPFDLDLLQGHGIVVRRAEEGERLVTLDDVERALSASDLVIADHAKAVAVAGVMGSASAEVSSGTKDVVLESAQFERRGIVRTSRRLRLQTEASVRFGRGADPEAVGPAADRAAALIARWSGGTVLTGSVDVGEVPERTRVSVRIERTARVLGYRMGGDEVRRAFDRLGLSATERRGVAEVEIPGYRPDLEIEEDLIEEVGRLLGYERVPQTLPPARQPGEVPPGYRLRRRIRGAMVRAGLRESVTFSFASEDDLRLVAQDPAKAVRVTNPLAADQAFLRPRLLPALLKAVRYNLARAVRGVALFEIGRTFRAGEGQDRDPVAEEESLAAALAGEGGRGYPARERQFDFFDAKGALETLMALLGIEDWRLGEVPGWPLHDGRAAEVLVGGEPGGVIGELHPRVLEALDLPPGTSVFELSVAALGSHAPRTVEYHEVPRFPPVRRDLAFVVDESVPAGAVQDGILAASGGLADDVVLFDVFQGDPVPPGRKSLAFTVDFRLPDRTLTDEDVEAVVQTIVARLRGELGAEFRTS